MIETSVGKLCSPIVGEQAGRRRLWRRSPMTRGRGGGLALVNDLEAGEQAQADDGGGW